MEEKLRVPYAIALTAAQRLRNMLSPFCEKIEIAGSLRRRRAYVGDIQVSMIVMKQAEFLEVFLPYVWDGRQTYFEAVKGGGFKQLPENTDENKETKDRR